MGIKLWLAPQISEHWPKTRPGFLLIILIIFKRPGEESALTPRDGKVQECSTSEEEIKSWTKIFWGRLTGLSVSKSRIEFKLFCMKESNSIFLKFLYS